MLRPVTRLVQVMVPRTTTGSGVGPGLAISHLRQSHNPAQQRVLQAQAVFDVLFHVNASRMDCGSRAMSALQHNTQLALRRRLVGLGEPPEAWVLNALLRNNARLFLPPSVPGLARRHLLLSRSRAGGCGGL